jgi:hypothetical protein
LSMSLKITYHLTQPERGASPDPFTQSPTPQDRKPRALRPDVSNPFACSSSCMYACVCVCVQGYMFGCKCEDVCVCVYVCVGVCVCVCVNVCVWSCVFIHMYKHTYIHMHMHTYIQTKKLVYICWHVLAATRSISGVHDRMLVIRVHKPKQVAYLVGHDWHKLEALLAWSAAQLPSFVGIQAHHTILSQRKRSA